MTATVSHARLQVFASDVLSAHGLRRDHADRVAEVLVWADLRGVDSHGVSRLPLYCQWLDSGEMNKSAEIETALDLPALCVLNGDSCPGAVGMLEASHRAAVLATKAGVGAVLLRQTTHTGALGFYTSAIAESGYACIAMVASGPLMGYFGSSAAAVSTAPLSIAAPRANGRPLVFDMASSAIPVGRLALARKQGGPLPPGSAMDIWGLPTQDPRSAVAPLPLAGPKGSGLALMVEVLCSLLSAAPILTPALGTHSSDSKHTQNALVIAFNTTVLNQPSDLQQEVARLADAIHALPPAKDVPEVLLPGERGWQESELRSTAGIPLSSAVSEQLAALAAKTGLSVPWN